MPDSDADLTTRSRRIGAAIASFALILAACSGTSSGENAGGDSVVAASEPSTSEESDSGETSTASVGASGDATGAATVESPTELELDGLTLQYDSAYWEVVTPAWGDEPGEKTRLFVNRDSLAVVSVGYFFHDNDSSLDPCSPDYTGERDPSEYPATLLYEETLSNDARLRIFQKIDSISDPMLAITEGFVQFDVSDDWTVGQESCLFSTYADRSSRINDGALTQYSVNMYWTFAEDQWITPFRDEFESVDAMRSRGGWAEMLALVQTIEVPGTPAA